jgi:hypothetical protein
MSLVEMLKLGKEIKQSPTTEVQLFKFDLDQLRWSKYPSVVEFVIESDPFGRGRFRNAFKATSQAKEIPVNYMGGEEIPPTSYRRYWCY